MLSSAELGLLISLLVTLGLLLARFLLWRRARPRPAPLTDPEWLPVIRVTDGDTLHVEMMGRDVTVRVLGIDTPETVHPDKPVEFYGPEASREAHRLLDGQHVLVTPDHTRVQHIDGYDRLLGYITLPDGTDYGHRMILNGFAHENTFAGQPYLKQQLYRAAEDTARAVGVGMWRQRVRF